MNLVLGLRRYRLISNFLADTSLSSVSGTVGRGILYHQLGVGNRIYSAPRRPS